MPRARRDASNLLYARYVPGVWQLISRERVIPLGELPEVDSGQPEAVARPRTGETNMSKTTFTGKGRLGLLLGLTGLLSFGAATAVRAQDDGGPADDTTVRSDQTIAQGPADDPRYANPKDGAPRNN